MTKQEELINLVASWLRDYCHKHDTTDSGWIVAPEIAWGYYRRDAIRLLEGEASLGVVIKVEGVMKEVEEAGYTLTEPLIEVK